jgi:hypothetical protein
MRENDIHVYKQSGADQQYRFQTANLCSTGFIHGDFFLPVPLSTPGLAPVVRVLFYGQGVHRNVLTSLLPLEKH